jgi:hypothetical protein
MKEFSRYGAANYLGLSPRTLDAQRALGRGPAYYRTSTGRIFYRQEDLDAYQKSRTEGVRHEPVNVPRSPRLKREIA